MQKTALILGARGRVGSAFETAFVNAGWQTRRYVRGTDMTSSAKGCDVILNGLNPPNYHNWAQALPAITTQVLAAARGSGATVLFPGNVYVFGDQPGPWGAETPHRPITVKGRVRAEVEARYRAAAADGVQTVILRAGDYMSPTPQESSLDVIYFRALAKGRVTSFGDPDARRAHAWLPDMARAGVALMDKHKDLPAFSDIPFPGHTFSSRELLNATARLLNKPLTLSAFPWWIMTALGPFWELARELKEMRYLYSHPHTLDPSALLHHLPDWKDTPFDEMLRQALQGRGFLLNG
ncbi:MAG: NAD-dependent epimerase/dehydratase family protein [Paracoccaceae bacterium]